MNWIKDSSSMCLCCESLVIPSKIWPFLLIELLCSWIQRKTENLIVTVKSTLSNFNSKTNSSDIRLCLRLHKVYMERFCADVAANVNTWPLWLRPCTMLLWVFDKIQTQTSRCWNNFENYIVLLKKWLENLSCFDRTSKTKKGCNIVKLHILVCCTLLCFGMIFTLLLGFAFVDGDIFIKQSFCDCDFILNKGRKPMFKKKKPVYVLIY